ncbi:MAG TPA: carbohydrate kinase family protein [Bellilinea sp.]|nr:carbohydrate kinase family protein [Bellilinea sp.]
MVSPSALRFIVAGKLQRDYILPVTGKEALDVPGGSLLYAAFGLKLWESQVGLIGRVGEDYPQDWLDNLTQLGFDRRGIRILPKAVDLRFFAAYPDADTRSLSNPVSHFARRGLHYPKSLLGYVEPGQVLDSRITPSDITVRITDFPEDYLDATAAHIAPLDFLSHTLLPSAFRQGHITTITLDPPASYMSPIFWDEIPGLLRGISVFHASEEKMRALFQGRSSDLWEMADSIASHGCELVVIKRGVQGQLLYDHAHHLRWTIPAYPARVVDPTGAGDAFCGGFLAGYRETYDPLESALRGNISASVIIEGTTPLYANDSLPSLVKMRLESLRTLVRRS